MPTEAEWVANVGNTLPGLKADFFDGTKTKEQYDADLAVLIAAGNDVPDSPLKMKTAANLQVAKYLV